MGDFFLDFRHPDDRATGIEETLQFFPDLETDRIQVSQFDLVLTRSGDAGLWAPFRSADGTTVALAGRIALDSADWDRAQQVSGEGGLACKAIYKAYQTGGIESIGKINGAYAIHLYVPDRDQYSIITDEGGCYPCFCPRDPKWKVFSSHPDALATAIPAAADWDYTSFAEFLATGQIGHPHTYYKGIAKLDRGTRYIVNCPRGKEISVAAQQFAETQFRIDPKVDEDQLADELVSAVSRATKQATQPILGRTLITVSGGLDCRLLLSHANLHENLRAVCIRGVEENAEFRVDNAIARDAGVELQPLIRSFDHYADNAEMAIRISGGMGDIGKNHFLGFRDQLQELSCDNLVTGDFFDYLFKSTALDVKESAFLRREVLTEYRHENYLPHIAPTAKFQQIVEERFVEKLPDELIRDNSESARLRIAAHRTFPLSRASADMHRQVAPRIFGWYAPASFREILDVYWRTPMAPRIGKSLFKKILLKSVSPTMKKIVDNNTGLPIDAPPILVSIFRYRIALRRHFERNSQRLDTDESWLNWPYYLRHSEKIRELWSRHHKTSESLVEELTGRPYSTDVEQYLSVSIHYFLRLLSLKLWAEQRS